jgi:hypothetical protein
MTLDSWRLAGRSRHPRVMGILSIFRNDEDISEEPGRLHELPDGCVPCGFPLYVSRPPCKSSTNQGQGRARSRTRRMSTSGWTEGSK